MHADLADAYSHLEPLLARVAQVHGPQDPRLALAHGTLLDLGATLQGWPAGQEAAAAHLARLRRLTDDFLPPDHACRSYRLALVLLADLEDLLRRRTTHGATR